MLILDGSTPLILTSDLESHFISPYFCVLVQKFVVQVGSTFIC